MKLAFYKNKEKLFNRAVCWWCNSKYSHVEVILEELPDGLSRCASSSYSDHGVRIKNIDLKDGKWDIMEISANEDLVHAWFNKHLGENYDLLGLFGFIFRRGIQNKIEWFCSESVADAMGFEESWRYEPGVFATTCLRLGGKFL